MLKTSKLSLILTAILSVNACQLSYSSNNGPAELEVPTLSSEQIDENTMDRVHVTAIKTDSNLGDSSTFRGTLHIKNNCLYIDDMLVVMQTPYLRWKQNPFTIYNELNGQDIKINDHVEVGGSSAEYSSLNFKSIKWQNIPDNACKSERVWLTNSMDLL